MTMVFRVGWRGALLALSLVLACGASDAAAPRDLRFEQFGVEQGLPQPNATAILQDRQGFIWVGSQAGLSRYDGYRVTVFRNRPDDPDSLPDNWVTALHEDAEGRLWVGTRGGGVARFDSAVRTFKRYWMPQVDSRGTGNLQVRAIVGEGPARAGSAGAPRLWIATSDGLQRLDTASGSFEVWQRDPLRQDSLASDDIQALAWDRQGRLWIGTGAGLDRMEADGRGFSHFRIDSAAEPDAKHNAVAALRVDDRGTMWVGTLQGLEAWTLDEPAPRRRRFVADVGVVPIRAILQDADGVIWVGSWAGLLRWDGESERFIRYRHDAGDATSLADDQVDSLLQDRSGTLWVGTNTNGTSRVDLGSSGFERVGGLRGEYGSRDDNKVYAIASDPDSRLWLGTVGGGLKRVDRRTGDVKTFRHDPATADSLPHDIVRAVRIDKRGQLWVGTHAGIARFDPAANAFSIRHFPDVDPALDVVRHLRIGPDGILWVGTEGGLHRYDPATDAVRTWRHDAAEADSLSQGRVLTSLEDRNGTLWVGTDSGLDRLVAGEDRFAHFRHEAANPHSLSHNRVTYLFEDQDGGIWIGTAGGLNRMEVDAGGAPQFRAYTMEDGLGADGVGAIQQDASGGLWVSTTAGVSRFDPASGQVRNFDSGDGALVGGYYVSAAHAAADGQFYFGGPSGLTTFRPEAMRDNVVPPPVVISELQVFNHAVLDGQRPEGVQFDGPIESAKSLRLSHANSVFSLEFAALHFADPRRNRYAHRLVGFDPEWVETDASRRFVTYTNLDPGEYEFQVKAANKDGVWNESGASLGITIDPPFWATWWFRVLAALALVGGLAGAYRYRVRGLTRHRLELEAEVRARTGEVVAQKEDIEQARATLAVLGEIGREITATLDEAALFRALDHHVHGLLDATSFAIYLLDADEKGLTSALRVEDGADLPVARIEIDNPTKQAARCARERRELHVVIEPGAENPSHFPGTLATLSALFAPLAIGDRLLGVMTIQSLRRDAYGERERLVFRTLCAYGAIALDNALAYRRLGEADAALQRALQEQQVIFDNVAAAVFFIKNRFIHRCNRGMEEMLGYGPGELIGQSTTIYHPSLESWEAQGRQVYPLITAGKVAEGEWEIVRKDGERLWIAFRGRALDPEAPADGSIWVAHDITERKRTEAELELVRREQQIILDHSAGGGILLTRNRTIVRCSPGLEAMLGYEPGTAAGKPVREYFRSDEAYEKFGAWAYPIMAAGGTASSEVEYVDRDGQPVQTYVSGKAIDPADLSRGVVWMAQDMRQQKRDAAELDRARRELQIIFDNDIGAIAILRDGRIERCSLGFETMYGYAPGEAAGMPIEAFAVSRESSDALGEATRPELLAGKVVSGEFEYLRKDGSTGWLIYQGRALEPGDLDKGTIWLSQDISELKQTESALQRALREQQTLFDNVLGGILFTRDTLVVRTNRGMEVILGYEPGELDGRTLRSLHASDEAYESGLKKALPVLAEGGIAQGEVQYVRKDGEPIWVVYSGKAIDPGDLAQGVVWVGLDIRAQKGTEAALKRALQEQEAIFDNMTGAMWIARDNVIHRCNRGFEDILGLRPGAGAGKPLRLGFRSEEDFKHFVKSTAPDIMLGKVVSGEWEFQRSNGERRWMLFQGKALDPHDIAQGTIWFGTDITERKNGETVLRDANERLERGLAEVGQLNRQVTLLGEMTGFLQACPSAEEAFACIGDFGPRLFPESAGALYLAEENGDSWIEHGRWGGSDREPAELAQSFLGNECWALRRSRVYRVDAPTGALCCPHVPATQGQHRPYACLPLTAQGKTFGLLHIAHQQALGDGEDDRRYALAVAMAEQIALAIANVQLREALLQQSIRDPLTGLYNRRYLQETLFREMAHSKRNATTFAVLMIDVDHFKKFNDTFGHHAGDVVLQAVARTIEARFRRSDVACRFGGEEFTVLLPGTGEALASRLANDVLAGIRDLVLSHENRPLDRITASLGVAVFPDHGGSPQALIEAADAALYRAKEAGRNRVMVSGSQAS